MASMQITPEIIKAIKKAGEVLNTEAHMILNSGEAKLGNSVGQLMRNGAEEYFQQSNLIAGWVQRAEKEFEKK